MTTTQNVSSTSTVNNRKVLQHLAQNLKQGYDEATTDSDRRMWAKALAPMVKYLEEVHAPRTPGASQFDAGAFLAQVTGSAEA
jgi:hypothetical protein